MAFAGGIEIAFCSSMNKSLLSIIMSVPLLASACGGNGGGGTPGPTAPSNTPAPGPTGTTVNIVSSAGANAFNPNPVQVPSGGSIVWRNSTSDVHTLVMSDGTSIGTVAAGASMTTTLRGSGGNYRCTLHPTMVGSINGATPPSPPDDDDDDGY